jgi:hypothetical protein
MDVMLRRMRAISIAEKGTRPILIKIKLLPHRRAIKMSINQLVLFVKATVSIVLIRRIGQYTGNCQK